MPDFGLVVFEEEKRKTENKKTEKIKTGKRTFENLAGKLLQRLVELLFNAGFFKFILFTRLYYLYRKNDFLKGLFSYELLENVKAWVIKLPFSPRMIFHLNIDFISEYLERICSENNILHCIVPEPLRREIKSDGVFKEYHIPEKILFKSLLIQVLEEIYPKAGIRIENLDLVIVHGSDNEELHTIIRLLEPYLKYVTILSPDKDGIESRLKEISDDSGLSYSISSDYRNRLKHADLIINLGKPFEILRCRLSRKSLLVNLYDTQDTCINGENTVINGVTFDIEGIDAKNLFYEVQGYYSKNEVYRTIFAHRLDLAIHNKFNYETALYVREEFINSGCRLTGFAGRRGSISIANVIKSVTA